MANVPKRYPDGFIRRRPFHTQRNSPVVATPTPTDHDIVAAAARHNNLLHARRIRRVARIMIAAARLDTSAQQVSRARRRKALSLPFVLARNNVPRFAAVLFLFGFVVSSLLLPLLQANNEKLIQLNEASKLLVGETRDDASRYLKYDDTKRTYTFAAEQRDMNDTYDHSGRFEDAYEATIPKKAADGITVTDTNLKINITLTPQFFTTEAEKSESNNLVYRSGNRQLVYTLKYNGLKEDIILPSYQGDELQFNFRLSLPAGVEARLDNEGNIGIYSSDPTLFGNISFGTDADRAKLNSAREKAAKNNLVMTIPFPVIKDAKGQEYNDRAKYTLGDKRIEKRSVDLPENGGTQLNTFTTYNLRVVTNSLKSLAYPISVDPTIQVKDASDFSKVQLEGNASLDTTNSLIKRASLTGGVVNGWTQATNNPNTLPAAGYGPDIQFYNDKLYFVKGGVNIQYAQVNSGGDIGSFTDTGVAPPGGEQYGSVAIYNGYLYAGSGTHYYYAKINDNGSISAFLETTVFTTPNGAARGAYAISAYNGYIYMSGGKYCLASCNDLTSTYTTDVQYAKINGDGSLSAWASAGAAFTNARALHRSVAYNGYFYVLGGWQGSLGSAPTNVQYAKINNDGTLGAWGTTTAMTSTRTAAAILALNGYLYVIGGSDITATAHYAPIYADGSLGSWAATDSITNGRGGIAGATYKDTIYVGGGSSNNGGTTYADVQYATIKPAGHATAWTQDAGTSYATSRRRLGVAVYNSYIYIAGGCSNTNCGSGDAFSDVQYAPINADGSIGTWQTTSSLTTQRAGTAIAIYNGVMYVSGGFQNLLQLFTTSVDRAVINANGTLGTFTADSNNFSQGRSQHASIAYNGYLYIIGGRDTNSNALTGVERAPISADGSLGAFVNDSPLSTKRAMGRAVVSGGRLYMIGGCTDFTGGSGCTTSTNTIEFAAIAANGSLTWSSNPTNYPVTIAASVSYPLKGYMYVYEGGNLRYTTIDATTGILGSWTTINSTQDHGEGFAGDMNNDFLYVAGGSGGGTRVDYTQINNGGTGGVGTWASNSTSFTTGRHRFGATVATNGYLYVAGGCKSTVGACNTLSDATTNTLSDVQYAKINSDGSLGTFATTTSLPVARSSLGFTSINGYLYVADGTDNTGASLNTTLYAQTTASGALAANSGCGSTWCTGPTTPFADGVTMASYGNYMYMLGANGTIYYAKALPSGAVDTWQTGSTTQSVRALPSLAIYAGYIYVIGGYTSGPVYSNVVEYASLNVTTGALSSFAYTNSSQWSGWGGSVAAYNGYMYHFAGTGGSSNLFGGVEFAPILALGKLGTWQATTKYTTSRFLAQSVQSNGYLFIMGGCNNGSCTGSVLNDTQHATMQSILRIAQISKLYDFDDGVKPTKLITRGTKHAGSSVSVTYTSNNAATGSNVLDNQQTVTDTGYGGSNAQAINLGTNRTLSRYLFLRYTIDDSLSAVFPDSGNESTITDFDMYYVANPGDRLRGGRSFTNGSDRGLDAQPQ